MFEHKIRIIIHYFMQPFSQFLFRVCMSAYVCIKLNMYIPFSWLLHLGVILNLSWELCTYNTSNNLKKQPKHLYWSNMNRLQFPTKLQVTKDK